MGTLVYGSTLFALHDAVLTKTSAALCEVLAMVDGHVVLEISQDDAVHELLIARGVPLRVTYEREVDLGDDDCLPVSVRSSIASWSSGGFRY